MRRTLPGDIGRAILASVLALSILSVPPFTDEAHAANPDCAPTVFAPSVSTRGFLFTSTTLCDWMVPAGFGSVSVQIFGGGGGGGGGSWSGSHGGGGGGGGAGGINYQSVNLTEGSKYSIQIGAGGAGGAGATSQGTTAGTAGTNGGTSSFNGTYSAIGGFGGGAGNGDTGGTGGANGGPTVGSALSFPALASRSGGAQANGNGGAGSNAQSTSGLNEDATNIQGGTGQAGPAWSPYNSVLIGGGGGGGANQTSAVVTGNSPSRGGSATLAVTNPTDSSTGGGGGHGCAGTSSTCANKSGATGSNGVILIYGTFFVGISSQPISFESGSSPTYPTLSTSHTIGTVTWSVTPSLPAGISLNTSTGVISGTPTQVTPANVYGFRATDSFGTSTWTAGWRLAITQGKGATPTFSGTNLVYNVPTALFASGGSGTGVFKFTTSSPDCILTGNRGETVTAQKASGTCSITAEKQGDANFYAASSNATFTMVKQVATNILTTSISSPREENSEVTLTATVSAGQSGTVTFSANGSAISNCGVSGAVTISGTTATCIWRGAASGSIFTLTSSYSGDSNFQSKSSNSISFTLYPSIALSYSDISTTFGNTAQSTPTISGGTGIPSSWSWAIGKSSDSSSVSGITINSSGVISVANNTSAGTYSMTIRVTDAMGITKSATTSVFVGLSTAAAANARSDKLATTVGATINLYATVVAAATGTITFKSNGSAITGCSAITISSGSSTCAWVTSSGSSTPVSITASYSGDGSYASSTSAAFSLLVAPAAAFTYTSQNYTFGTGAVITPSIANGTGNNSSWVIKNTSDNSSDFNFIISPSGVVSVSKGATLGTHNLTITAVDDAGITGTGTLQVNITKATPTITLEPKTIAGRSLTSGTLGHQVRLVVTISVPSSGSVVIYGNGVSLCTASAYSGSAECWWAPSDATGSPYSLYATYAGDSSANGATSSTLSGFVWSPSPSISYTNQSVETGKSATITPAISGGTGSSVNWTWVFFQHITGNQIGGIRIGVGGVISVSGTVQPGIYDFDIAGYDATDASAGATLTITIADVTPPAISISSSSETVTKNSAISGFTVTNTGSAVSIYQLDLPLPAGLSLNSSTGALSGTPTETITSTTYTLMARNLGGIDTATFTLTINDAGGGGGVTITLSLAGGVSTASKGASIEITASISVAGKIRFLANGKVIGGCAAVSATSAGTCSWKPTVQGQNVALTAILNPNSNSYSIVKSAALNVGVGRRTGRR